MTFLAVEKRIASSLRERVQTTADTINADDVRAIATRRQAGHWASPTVAGSTDVPRQALHAVYDALVAAADFYALRNQYTRAASTIPTPPAMYRAYESELYRFDQLYRHFCEAADLAEAKGWNILKPLRDEIEACYVNWYLTNLALAWGKFIEPHGGLLAKWQIDKVPNQYDFYDRNVRPWLEEGENRRAFVIISDAFRYEAAQELTTRTQRQVPLRGHADLATWRAAVVHGAGHGEPAAAQDAGLQGQRRRAGGRQVEHRRRAGRHPASGGTAWPCKADELMAKKKDEGREFVNG